MLRRAPRPQLHREVFKCPGCAVFTCVKHATAMSFQQDFESDWQLWTVRHSPGPKCDCGDAFNPYVCGGDSDHAGKVRCKTCKKIMRSGVIPFFTGTKLPLFALFGILWGTLHGHSQVFIHELTGASRQAISQWQLTFAEPCFRINMKMLDIAKPLYTSLQVHFSLFH